MSYLTPSSTWLAALELTPEAVSTSLCAEAALRIATRLGVRVQRVSPTMLLLDLSGASADEACALGTAVLARLAALGAPARVSIAPTTTLARLMLVTFPPGERLRCLLPEEAPTLLAAQPVARLGALGGSIIPEQIARLERYGLRTLGHLARLDEATLCHQFGRTTGVWLAAVAQGRDLAPLVPTPLPERVALGLRLAEPLDVEQVRAGLPALAARAAAALAARGRAAGSVALVVETETGATWRWQRVLPQPVAGAGPLARLLETLLRDPLALPNANVTRLTLTLERLVPALAAQTALWAAEAAARRRAQQARTAVREVAERLQHRHGRALLLQALPHVPDAIFRGERYRIQPLAGQVAEADPVAPSRHKSQATRRAPIWAETSVRLHWW